jgi:hypothetical protein
MRKVEAVQKMIQMLQLDKPPLFVVILQPGSGYKIDGYQHEELHLTVSAHHTPPSIRLKMGSSVSLCFLQI